MTSTGVGVPSGSFASWPCWTNSRNLKSAGSSSCARQKPWIMAATFRRVVDSFAASAFERHRERNVVPLECLPDEVILALEVAVERTLRQAHRQGDVPDGGFGDPFFDEQPDCGLFDALTGVGECVARHSE